MASQESGGAAEAARGRDGVATKLEALRRCEELICALELRIWPANRREHIHCPDPDLLEQLAAHREEADRLFIDIAEMTGEPPLRRDCDQG